MIVPDPAIYPEGLKQYLLKFQNDASEIHLRVNGHIVAHISTPDGQETFNLEPPLDWKKR